LNKKEGIVVYNKNLFIEPTAKSPQIDLNHFTGELIFSGKSIPEDATKIYENIFKWVQNYTLNPKQTTNLRLKFEYYNTSSLIWIAKIVRALCSMTEIENTVMIHVYLDLEDEDYQNTLSPIIDMVGSPIINVEVKIYGTDEKGIILKESIVFK
jgi:hypothetical protein